MKVEAQCNTCSSTNTISIANGNTTSSSILTGNFNNTTVCIIDNFTVNSASFSFIKCKLKISPGVTITVTSGCTLNIDNSSLYACGGSMWNGIALAGSGIGTGTKSILNIGNQSVIEDAENAINITGGGAEYHISGKSYFNKNWISIYKAASINHYMPSTIEDSYFTCRSIYNNPATNANCLIAPHISFRSSRFIWIQNSNHQSLLNVGVAPPSAINYFDNAGIAIDAYWCFSNIIYNNIKNCNTGVHLTYDGTLIARQNTINTCTTGLLVDLNGITSAEITDNNVFENLGTGIYVQNSPHLSGLTINNNTFSTCANFGIRCNTFFTPTPGYAPICNINQNTFSSSVNARAIELTEVNQIATAKYFVNENSITDFASGIIAINLKKATFNDNTIHLSQPTSSLTNNDAINFAACPAAIVKRNMLTSTNLNGCAVTCRGIVNEGNNGAVIGCNSADLIGRQFCFFGTTTGNTFVENTMSRGHDQVYLFNNPGLGKMGYGNGFAQGWNKWNAPDCNDGSNTFADVNSNPNLHTTIFYTSPNAKPILNKRNNSATPLPNFCEALATGWIMSQSSCSSPIALPNRAYFDGAIEIAADSILASANEDDLQWLAKSYLYNEFESDSLYLDSTTIVRDAVVSLRGTNIGLISSIIKAIIDNSDETLITALIANLAPANPAEQNYKDLLPLELKIRTYDLISLSGSEIDLIRSIADQCPDGGGNAVYSARVLLSLIDGTDSYRPYCTSSPNRYGALNFEETNSLFAINPNPATDYFEFNTTAAGTLIIYNYLGSKVVSLITLNGNNRLDLKTLSLNKGCYLLQLQGKKTIQSCKLIIN